MLQHRLSVHSCQWTDLQSLTAYRLLRCLSALGATDAWGVLRFKPPVVACLRQAGGEKRGLPAAPSANELHGADTLGQNVVELKVIRGQEGRIQASRKRDRETVRKGDPDHAGFYSPDIFPEVLVDIGTIAQTRVG